MTEGHDLNPISLTIDLEKEVTDQLLAKVINSPKVDRITYKHSFLGDTHIELLKRLNVVFQKRPDILFDFGNSPVKLLDYMPDLRSLSYRGNEWPEFENRMVDRGNINRLWVWIPDASKKGPDISFIANFSNTLTELWLKYISINAYEAISKLTALKTVFLESPKLPDLGCLCFSPNIEELTVWGSRIADISQIEKLKKLRSLRIVNNTLVENVDFISTLTNLEYIDLSNVSKVKKWPKCDHILNLRTIWLNNCKNMEDRTEFDNWEKSRIGKPQPTLNWEH